MKYLLSKISFAILLLLIISCDTPANNTSNSYPLTSSSQYNSDIISPPTPLHNNISDIIITNEASKVVDSTFSILELNTTDKITLKQTLSDPNSDTENKSGLDCSIIEKYCKWCGKSFLVQQKYTTYKSILEKFNSPIVAMGIEFINLFGGKRGVSRFITLNV